METVVQAWLYHPVLNQEGPGKPSGTEIKWDTSASGLG
jgi:hypothetical protein